MGAQNFRMRLRLITLTLCLMMAFICLAAGSVMAAGVAGQYYVDIQNGDDSGDGQLTPWKTLHYAVSQLQPGDTLNVQPGTYKVDTVTPANGEADSPLTIYTGNIRIVGNGASGEVIIDGAGAASWFYGIQVYDEVSGISGIVIENIDIRNFSENGIRFEGYVSNVLIQNCRIYQNAVAGVYLEGNGRNRIEDSSIYDNGISGTPGVGVIAGSENNIISGNQVFWSGIALSPNFPQGLGVDITSPAANNIHSNEVYGHTTGSLPAGIKVTGSTGTAQVYDNRIHDNTTGVYVFESAPEIHRNLLKDNTTGIYISYNYINTSPRIINNLITTSMPSSIGIDINAMPSGPTPAVLIYHNTIYGAADKAIQSNVGGGYAAVPDILYNIISNTTLGYGIFQKEFSLAPTIEYNLFFANTNGDYFLEGAGGGIQPLTGTNLTEEDPLFVDPASSNCRLSPDSPAINAITAANHNLAVFEDFDRVSRPQYNYRASTDGYDMGCFEAIVFYYPTITWTGSGGNSLWSNPLNWNPQTVPGSNDRVLIPGGFDVEMDADFSAVPPVNDTILSIENHGTVNIPAGKVLTVEGEGSFMVNTVDGTLQGKGDLNASVHLWSANYGTLAPGTSAGILTINGDHTMDPSARLEIEIGGTGPDMFDKLIINGQLNAGGEIYATLIDGYEPQIGHSFEIMTFASLTGFFGPVILPPLPDGMIWRQTLNTSATPNTLTLDVVAANDGGTGTEFDPYLIATPEQLNHVRKLPDKYFRQVANIDLAGFASGPGWDPIGSDGNCFTGSYDGSGYTISSLTINRPSEETIGLFGCVGEGGRLKNITLNNISITCHANIGALAGNNSGVIMNCSAISGAVAGTSTFGTNTGGLVGYNTGQVEQCHAVVTVNGPENIGGLVGYHENGTISQSYAEGPVTGSTSVGGFAGSAEYGQMINCFAAGSVTGIDTVGGFMGEGWTAYVTNCYAVGSVSGDTSVGGLIGVKTYSTVTNSYYDSDTTGQSDNTGQGEPKTTSEMKTGTPSGSIYIDWYSFVWDFEPTSAYPVLRWNGQSQSTGWIDPGSMDDTVNGEPWPSGQIKPQVAMAGNGDTLIVWAQYDGSYSKIYKNEYRGGFWSGPEIISPDGTDAFNPQAAMDGNGNAIIVWQQYDGVNNRIYKNEYQTAIGWDAPAPISLSGTDADAPQAAMAGSGDAMIVWQQSDGVNNRIYKYEYFAGAWTGLEAISLAGTDASSPQVAMDDNGDATNADAVIVWQQYDGVSNSLIYKSEYRGGSWTHPADLSDHISPSGIYAMLPQVAMADNGDAVITWEQSGYNMELYMMEYRNMTVWSSPVMISPSGSGAGTSQVAMNKANGDTIIVWAQNEEFSYGKRIFMSEYRSGIWTHPLTRNNYISQAGYEADNAHAAMDGNGNAVIVWSNKGNGVYTGWISMMEYRAGVWKHAAEIPPVGEIDSYYPYPYSPDAAIDNIGDAVIAWDVFVGKDDGYTPIWRVYKSEYRSGGANPFAGGSGTELDPYQIETAAQLAAVKDYFDSYFIVNADLDLGQPPWNDGLGWAPIGTETEMFTGHFDGNCKTITTLFIDRSGDDFVGLFGYIGPGAEIKNLAVKDVSVTGRDAVGALVGKNDGGLIKECLATGTVTGNGSDIGGVGGLVGYNYDPGIIQDSYAIVRVSGTGQYIGGLVGKNFNGSITASYSSGRVTGDATAGGLVGIYDNNPEDRVVDCYWNTETSGQTASEGGVGLTTIEMRQQSSFPIWDVSGIWVFPEGVSFPYIQCFGQIQFTLSYSAGANGSLSGSTLQVLNHGVDSSPITATPDTNYHFFGWSDGSIQNPRIDTAVSDVDVTADFVAETEYLDFGDAPDPTYPTLLASDGARHTIVDAYSLGNSVDPDLDGQPDAGGIGDDDDGNDDEDGVVFGASPFLCQQLPVTITASGAGYIDAWIDYNADGDWADTGEQIFTSQAVAAGTNNLNFTVPCDAALGKTFARFRFSSGGGLTYTGLAVDGEVEDYALEIFAPPAPLGQLSAIPDTGQATCYDNTAAITCPGSGAFSGQDFQYQPQHPRSYTKLGMNGLELPDTATQPDWLMTRDNVTGLIWEIKTAGNQGDSYTWSNASADFIAGLNASSGFGGFTDWRLPTVKELTSLVNSGMIPAIDSGKLPNMTSYYWTSADFIIDPNGAWGVDFAGGDVSFATKDTERLVIAVRQGPVGAPDTGVFANAIDPGRMLDNGDGTVTDTVTGLMWQQATNAAGTWESALSSAEGLSLAGHDDWRLPNRNELQTLVDYTQTGPAINVPLFSDTISWYYWTSTTDAGNPALAWRINFNDGGIDIVAKTADPYVFRAVRGGQFGDGAFSISSPTQGSKYAQGDMLSIEWAPLVGGSGNVRILLSRDGGSTFDEIVALTENDGSDAWLVTGLSTVNAMIRIEDAVDSAIYREVGFFTLGDVFNLFVAKAGTGTGTVTSVPAQIDCGAECVGVFPKDTAIQLAAVPDSGFIFAGWADGTGSAVGCSGTGTCSFTISETSSITANFETAVVITPGEYWVDSAGGSDETGDGSELNPWQTLHHAINNRINTGTPGTVLDPYILNVAAGNYTTAFNGGGFETEEVLFITQDNLTIQGAGIGSTVIDGTGSPSSNWIDGLDAHRTSGVIMKDMEIMHFPANGIHMGGAVNGVVESCSLHGNGLSGIMIETDGGSTPNPSSGNIIRTGCEIYNNGGSGIYIRNSHDNQIINNLGSIYDNGNADGGTGIYIEGGNADNNDITNNHIYSTGDLTYRQNVGIYLENVGAGSQIDIEQNVIESHLSSGIYIFGGGARIKRNTLMNNLRGVYVFAVDGVETSPAIWNNLFYSGEVPGMNTGIYLQMSASGQITTNLTIYNNTIDRAIADGLYIDATLLSGGVCEPSIYYNIISNSQSYGINNVDGIATMDYNGYNDVFNSGVADYAGCTAGAGSISGDPVYVVDGTDYHLGVSSPCIDASDGGFGPDLDGNSRPIDIASVDNGGVYDMGCYEATPGLIAYTVNFIAGAGGGIDGILVQTVAAGSDCTPVTAVPETGYEFAGWTGDYTGMANPLTLTNVTSNMTVTANFRIKPVVVTRTVRFIAEAGGSISGSATQTVPYSGNCSPVTAVPNAGYDFIGWSGSFSGAANPLTITNVTSDMTIYANFREPAAVTYSVRFIAEAGGQIDGNLSQTIAEGRDCGSVTAVPDSGYLFAGWTGDYTGTENPLTLKNVTSNKMVTANFEVMPVRTFSVNFIANAGGHINGNSNQTVKEGGGCTAVTAEAEDGYVFEGWSGDHTSTDATLTIANVASHMTVYANFQEKAVYTVSFIAGAGGRIDGNSVQVLEEGSGCTAVTAIPDAGYKFTGWIGDYIGTDATLTLTNVTSNMTVNAGFEENTGNQPPEKPELISPKGNAVMAAGPFTLHSGLYVDPENDPHTSTWWQVSRFNLPGVVYSEQSGTDLEAYEISQGLDAGLKYSWRAGYQDAGSGEYSWSDEETFLVGESAIDPNIPPVGPGITMSDYRMVSFIQWPLDASAEGVFGALMGGEYDTSLFRIGVYDPTLGSGGYREYPDFTVEPGQTYWFLARDGIDLTGAGVPVSTSVDFCIGLKFNAVSGNGWNMIAPPNDRDYRWGDLQVTVTDGQGNTVFGPMPVSRLSADNEYIDVRIWGWDQGAYTASTSPDFLLERYSGYWVRAKQANVFICFPADAGIASRSGGVMDSIWSRLTAWAGSLLPVTDTAYANAPNDTPPMPMSGLGGEKAGGSVGCFIDAITAPSN